MDNVIKVISQGILFQHRERQATPGAIRAAEALLQGINDLYLSRFAYVADHEKQYQCSYPPINERNFRARDQYEERRHDLCAT